MMDILNIIIIPIAIVLLPLIWGLTATWFRRMQFQELIFREIEEIGPHPPNKPNKEENKDGKNWTDHHSNKSEKFIHPKIFNDPTQNRDFILSLKSDLVYYVTQLWNSKEDGEQWLYMISQIETKVPFWQRSRHKNIWKMKTQWYALMKEYDEEFGSNFDRERYENDLERLQKLKEKEDRHKTKEKHQKKREKTKT